MKTKLEEQLEKALKEKERDDVLNHPLKVRLLAKEYFAKSNLTSTPEIKTNGYSIVFNKGTDSSTDSITMSVNGKLYRGNEMDKKINEIDLVGPDFNNNRKQFERSKDIKNKAKNIGRLAKIDITRKIINEPAHMVAEGQGIMMHLLRLLGRTISKSVQSH